ncbi:MAG: hypothetical protein SH847_22460 [Roseiflexaceae bacterium]|nr:hypothetical protein [Roseiflexaceae bacterium]
MIWHSLRRAQLATAYHRSLYLLLAPYLIGITLLVLVPIIYTIGLSFATYDALSPPIWNGLGNFRMLSGDPLFLTAIRNSLLFVSLTIPLRVLLTLLVALLLNRWRRDIGVYRAAIYPANDYTKCCLCTQLAMAPESILWPAQSCTWCGWHSANCLVCQ